MDENRLPSWLPREQPLQALTIFGIVLLLAAVPIAVLAVADGKDDEPFGSPRTITEERAQRIDPPNGPPVVTVPGPTGPTGPPPATTPAPTTPTPPSVPPPAPTPSEPEEKPPVIRSIGEPGVDDGIEFTVRSVKLVKSVRADRYREGERIRAPRGGRLVKADVAYTNNTGKAVDPFCGSGSSRAIDHYDRPHEAADSLYEIPGNEPICGGNTTPDGASADVTLVFELPKGRRLKSIELYNDKADDYDGQASFVRVEVP
jgi:hypothetical protein